MSHDEAFVDQVITEAKVGPSELPGKIYVLSKHTLQAFEGSFRDYKKLVLKKMAKLEAF